MILQLIKLAGDQVSEEIWYRVIQIITNQGDELQKYATETVWRALAAEKLPHRTLVKVAGFDRKNDNSVPSPGDTLTLTFDRWTNRGANARPGPPRAGSKEYADFFFVFTPGIGADYFGEFTDDSTFVITIVEGNPDWGEIGDASLGEPALSPKPP